MKRWSHQVKIVCRFLVLLFFTTVVIWDGGQQPLSAGQDSKPRPIPASPNRAQPVPQPNQSKTGSRSGTESQAQPPVSKSSAGSQVSKAQPDRANASSQVRTRRIEYNDPLNARIETDFNGQRTMYQLDALGREAAVYRLAVDGSLYREGVGGERFLNAMLLKRKAYDADNRLVMEADAEGRATCYGYDGAGRMVKKTTGLFLPEDSLVPQSTPAMAVWRYQYDRAGNLSAEYSPRLDAVYSSLNHVLYWHHYNTRNERIATTDAEGYTTSFEYDGMGRKTAAVSAMGRRTQYGYDSLSRLVKVTQAAGSDRASSTYYIYDYTGPARFQVDGNGSVVEKVYDAWYRMAEYREWLLPADQVPGIVRTADGGWALREHAASAAGDSNRQPADQPIKSNRRTPAAKADAGYIFWFYEYDAGGNLVSVTDPDGRVKLMEYDQFNRLVKESFAWPGGDLSGLPDNPLSVVYRYDKNSNPLEVKEEKQVRPALAAQGAGEPAGAAGPWVKVIYTTRYVYDNLDRIETQKDAYWGPPTGFYYSRSGSRTGVVFPGEDAAAMGKPSLRYTYDAGNRLTAVYRTATDGAQTPSEKSLAVYDYFADGLLNKIHYSNGVTTAFGYYDNGWTKTIETVSADGTLVGKYAYKYDPDGNRSEMQGWNATPGYRQDHPDWFLNPQVTNYFYDMPGRLIQVVYRLGEPDTRYVNYTYDKAGNRLIEIVKKGNGALIKDCGYVYNSRNQLVFIFDNLAPERSVRYEYNLAGDTTAKVTGRLDLAGNIVPGSELYRLEFGWDAAGKLRRVIKTQANGQPQTMAEFCYDYQGRRVRKDGTFTLLSGGALPGDSRFYIYDQTAVLSEYVPGPDSLIRKERQYIYGDELLACEHADSDQGLGLFDPRAAFEGSLNPMSARVDTFGNPNAGRPVEDRTQSGSASWLDPSHHDDIPRRNPARLKENEPDALNNGPGGFTSPELRYPEAGNSMAQQSTLLPSSTGPSGNIGVDPFFTTGRGAAKSLGKNVNPATPAPGKPVVTFYHRDALGSVVNLTGEQAQLEESYIYDAWGNLQELDVPNASSTAYNGSPGIDPATGLWDWQRYLADVQGAFAGDFNRFTYTGHEYDPETGLYYFKARFYDPDLGRFDSEDSYLGKSEDPPSLHRYLYAYDSPVRYVDLNGHEIPNQSEIYRKQEVDEKATAEIQKLLRDLGTETLDTLYTAARYAGEPVNELADLLNITYFSIYNIGRIQPNGARITADEAHFNSMLAEYLRRKCAEGRSVGDTIVLGSNQYFFGLGTAGLGPYAKDVYEQAELYKKGKISKEEFQHNVARLTRNEALALGLAEALSRAPGGVSGVPKEGVPGVKGGAEVEPQVKPAGEESPVENVQKSPASRGASIKEAQTPNVEVRSPNSSYYSVLAEAELKPETYNASDANHFRQANRQLYEKFQTDPEYAARMEAQYPGIVKYVTPGPKGGVPDTPPPGLTWHHVKGQPGKLQLAPRDMHRAPGPVQQSLHPDGSGGRAEWGGGRRKL